MRFPIAVIVLVALAGCADAQKQSALIEPEAEVPVDFWLELNVPVESALPRQDQPEMVRRYIVLPDATLHYAEQPKSPGPGGLPPVVRTLSQQQLRDLWELARPLMLSNPSVKAEPGPVGARALPGPRLMVCAQQQIRAFIPQEADEPARSEFGAIQKRVDVLAFSPSSLDTTTVVIPHRYDFGPDPYARYRR